MSFKIITGDYNVQRKSEKLFYNLKSFKWAKTAFVPEENIFQKSLTSFVWKKNSSWWNKGIQGDAPNAICRVTTNCFAVTIAPSSNILSRKVQLFRKESIKNAPSKGYLYEELRSTVFTLSFYNHITVMGLG